MVGLEHRGELAWREQDIYRAGADDDGSGLQDQHGVLLLSVQHELDEHQSSRKGRAPYAGHPRADARDGRNIFWRKLDGWKDDKHERFKRRGTAP